VLGGYSRLDQNFGSVSGIEDGEASPGWVFGCAIERQPERVRQGAEAKLTHVFGDLSQLGIHDQSFFRPPNGLPFTGEALSGRSIIHWRPSSQ
jgi:hypothetical protein